MNREILFRAKIRSSNEWIYWNVLGQIKTLDYLDDCYEYQEQYYTDINAICGLIDLATVGQYTGLKDKNGNRIFEGDCVKTKEYGRDMGNGKNSNDYEEFMIVFANGAFKLVNEAKQRWYNLTNGVHIEIIGNIHEEDI